MAKRSKLHPFIVAYGGEDHLLDRVMDLGRKWEGRECLLVDGEDIDEKEFVMMCSQAYFESDYVVVLDNAQKLKGEKILGAFVDGKAANDTATIVVAIVRADKLPDVWQRAAKKGTCYHHPKFKPWEEDKIQERIRVEADKLHLCLDKDVPVLLLRLLGDNLRLTVNEMRKLACIVPLGTNVTRADVLRVISPDVTAEPYEVAEAVMDRDAKTALRLLSTVLKNMGEGGLVPVTTSLLKQVEKLLVARDMLDKGDSPDIVAARLELNKFLFQKKMMPRVKKFTVAELRNQMSRLCRLETQVKGPARSKRTLVELAILSIAS